MEDWDGKRLFVRVLKDWTVDGATRKAGTLISIPDDAYDEKALAGKVETVYFPNPRSSLASAFLLDGPLPLLIRENVVTRLYTAGGEGAAWTRVLAPLPADGSIGIAAADPFRSELFVTYASFLVPTTLSLIPKPGAKAEALKSLPPRFNADGL